jgi:hypothetical protein
MNYKKYLIAIILLVLPAVVISSVAINEVGHIMRQKHVFAVTSSSSDSSDSSVHILKITTNSYTISSGSSSIGTFGTTYTIFGNVSSIKNASGLIISTITKDYDSSPTIGYVAVAPQTNAEGDVNSSYQLPTLANPFADKITIDQKIANESQIAIKSAIKSNFTSVELKCDFGMVLSDWKCSTHPLRG